MPGITLRTATAADIPTIVALVTCAYRGDASRSGWTTEADLLDGDRIDPEVLATDIARPRSVVLLAEERVPGTDARTVLACAHVAEQSGAGYFGMFSVHPERQGDGLGKRILAEAERIARTLWELPVMRMTVIDLREELIAYYERRGYRRTGRHVPFPYGDPRFGLPRRDDLRFEILEKPL